MGKKIIVAGGGHGGIATAAILAKNGFDVTVYEKNMREEMGYDWTDIFDKKCFTMAGMNLPEREKYSFKQDMSFVGPAEGIVLRQQTEKDKLEIQMERKDIYDHIISHAESCGVKFVYGCEIKAPIMLGNRVVGIETEGENIYADLVIDAAGINSPIRKNLPEALGVQNDVQEYEQFYVYRAFYNKTAETEIDKFKVLMLHEGITGICWVAAEEDYTDVLIGRFEKFDMNEANRSVAELRTNHPSIGTQVLRGGQFVNIPVRQPLGVLVADGYAAIGDCAFMTVPIIGSGIANSIKAARFLAQAVMDDVNGCYSAESLWKYQTEFYKNLGSGLAPLGCIKLLLTRLSGDELDYIFENGILNANDMTIDADSTNLTAMFKDMKPADLLIKVKGLVNNTDVLKKVLRLGKDILSASAATAMMPKKYDSKKVVSWVTKYNSCFKH